MLLASDSSCTAIVVNSYANHQEILLKGITADAYHNRVFADDGEDCDENKKYQEMIHGKKPYLR